MGDHSQWQGAAIMRSVQGAESRPLREWALSSLGGGLDVSQRALARLSIDAGYTRVVAPPDLDLAEHPPRAGMLLGSDVANDALLSFIRGLSNVATVLVEDELALRGDPALNRELGDPDRWISVSFIRDHPFWWSPVDDRAVELMHIGSAGFPRNAFLLSEPPDELGLVDLETLDESAAERIAASIRAVVVGVYDDESHLIWQP